MTDRELLPLADGSQWLSPLAVIDGTDVEVSVGEANGTPIIQANACGEFTDIWVRDLIALLHRAGLLDELLERAWLDGYAAAKYDVSETEKRGGKHETECPHSGKVASDVC